VYTKTYSNEVEKEENLITIRAAYDAFFAAVDSEKDSSTLKKNLKADEYLRLPHSKTLQS
jgi:hypothetical protein